MQQFILTLFLAISGSGYGYGNCLKVDEHQSASSFSAVYISSKNNSTTVTWFVSNSQNTAYFTVQASQDNREWKNRAIVFPGEIEADQYFFTDMKKRRKYLHYRIIRHDRNGSMEYSPVYPVKSISRLAHINMNISEEGLHFNTETPMESPRFMVWQPDGKMLFDQQFTGSYSNLSISLKSRFSGMVIVHINDGSGRSILEKIIL